MLGGTYVVTENTYSTAPTHQLRICAHRLTSGRLCIQKTCSLITILNSILQYIIIIMYNINLIATRGEHVHQ